ncbi:MAG: phage head-tail connector protein [Betaproteobacteria bacterium]|nr:phage head-tail connector protein [Betaproteobacteria bacterium]
MIFTLERVSQPDIEPVTLEEMRRHLRVTQTDTDTDITGLIVAAREWAEDYTWRALVDQSWRLTLDEYASAYANVDSDTVSGYRGAWVRSADNTILLRRSPVLAITSFVSVDSAGVETAIDAATYALREADSKWPRLVPLPGANWTSGPLRITFRAGFADRVSSPQQDADSVPFRFKAAMRLYAEALFDRDERMMKLLLEAAQGLLKPERAQLSLA